VIQFGATDPWVPSETVDAVQRIYVAAPHVAFHRYAETGHGFARNSYPPYQQSAGELAEHRSLRPFNDALLSGAVPSAAP